MALLLLLCMAMAAGSFVLTGEHAVAINAMPLLAWLGETAMAASWWLWVTVVLLVLLAVNTVVCSCCFLASRRGRAGLAALAGPQLVHAGFLLVILAHLISSAGGSKQQLEVGEGMAALLPDGRQFGVAAVDAVLAPSGMPVGYTCELVPDLSRPDMRVTISPNHPWLNNGYGVYIKHAEAYPFRRAFLEIHREPGAPMALAGAVVFTVGTVLLVRTRSRARENAPDEEVL